MGSSHDSRYWVCPHCCVQFDWEAEGVDNPETHDQDRCARNKRRRETRDQNGRRSPKYSKR